MDPSKLPNDPEVLKRMVLSLRSERAALHSERAALHSERVALRSQLEALKRRLFGRKTERVPSKQLSLLDEDSDPAAAVTAATEEPPPPPKRRRRRGGRGQRSLPAHVPVLDVTSAAPGPTHCTCCGEELKVIGEDVSERLEYIPGHFKRLRIHRTKRVCSQCPEQGVITQPAPAFALERALAADGLLAKIVTDKYADHIPLNRQCKRFSRETAVELSVSTMCGWLRRVGELLKHVVNAMQKDLVAGAFVQSDATGLPILEGSKNQPRRGQLWSYTDGEQVVMKASLDGRQSNPADFLEGFKGTLLTDGAGAYNLIAQSEDVTRAGCWAHARRKFFEARNEDPEKAGMALATIREIFRVEREATQMAPEARSRVRRERLTEKLAAFKRQIDTWSTNARPKSAMGKAITYARRQWDTLVVFLDDGNIPVHNNTSERLLRGPVIGRKNWLFAGSEGGAKTAAICLSVVASCMLVGVDPYAYLRDVLSLLPDAKPDQVRALTPKAWATRFGPTSA